MKLPDHYTYWDRPFAAPLKEANKVYRTRGFREGLIYGALAGGTIIATLSAAALGIFIRNL